MQRKHTEWARKKDLFLKASTAPYNETERKLIYQNISSGVSPAIMLPRVFNN